MRPLLLIIAVTSLVYLGVTDLGFVSDDHGLITHPVIGIGHLSLGQIFSADLWQFQASQSGYYRPLMMLSLKLDNALFGLAAAGHHLHSLLWHLIVIALIGGLFGKLLGRERGAIAAGIYAMHPLVSEQVCFISARNDSMALAFALGAVWLASATNPSRARLVSAASLAAAACLSKESGLVVLGLLPLLDYARGWATHSRYRYGALATGVAAAFGVRGLIGPGFLHAPPLNGAAIFSDAWFSITATMLGKLIWPLPLTDSLHVAYLGAPPLISAVSACLLMVGLCTLGGRWGRAGVAFSLISLAPAMTATASRFILGERYLVLPLLGLAIGIAGVLPRHKALPYLLVFMLPWGVANHARVGDWSTDLSLAQSAHRASASPYTAAWLGHAYASTGDDKQALPLFDAATAASPPTCDFASEWIDTTRRHSGAAAALETANKVWDRKCGGGPGVRGRWAEAHLAAGDVDSADRILSPRPQSCDASIAPALVSLYRLRGQPEAAEGCAQESAMPPAVLEAKVRPLVSINTQRDSL